MINSPDTASSIDYSFDDPARLEHIDRLIAKGYAVYFGELVVEAEISGDDTQDRYYALVVPLDEHQEQLNPVNQIRKAAHSIAQVRRTFYWLDEDPFTPVQRYTDDTVLSDPNLGKSDTAWGALVKAEKIAQGTESKDLVKLPVLRRSRLRQSQNQHHK